MSTTAATITVKVKVNAPLEYVWNFWTGSDHIIKWNSPSPDWHTTKASHDVIPGGKFTFRMEAKDGSMGFDFGGIYDEVEPNKLLTSTLGDGRKVQVTFSREEDGVLVTEIFEAENVNPIEQQRSGWQAIMDSFKNYVEASV